MVSAGFHGLPRPIAGLYIVDHRISSPDMFKYIYSTLLYLKFYPFLCLPLPHTAFAGGHHTDYILSPCDDPFGDVGWEPLEWACQEWLCAFSSAGLEMRFCLLAGSIHIHTGALVFLTGNSKPATTTVHLWKNMMFSAELDISVLTFDFLRFWDLENIAKS